MLPEAENKALHRKLKRR